LKNPLEPITAFQRRISKLSLYVGYKQALHIALAERTNGDIRIHLFDKGRDVELRSGTSDMRCFEKIFLAEDYRTPFPVEAKVIVDAGANVGMATLYYSYAYPNARIIAIEPESSNFKMLVRNCGNLPNVTLVEAALWHEERNLVLGNPDAAKWAFTVTDSAPASNGEPPKVAAVTIPGILKKYGVERIDILKLDIEGAELELFRNGSDAWLGSVGQIAIELHDRFKPGCAQGFYAAIGRKTFIQENRGENVFIKFEHAATPTSS
jgi:FkbM family methyltransferase